MRVAGYCRVSTDHDDQLNSFESQRLYFREYIERHTEWELYNIYADEGISGTGTKNRTQFNQMIQDAYDGKFSVIVTKEVSRFSRNILDTISYTRQLRSIGVGVRFLSDGIDTQKPDGEMLLSFLASLAQEESRKISSRVVWGQTRQMERGVVFGHSLLGYQVKDGKISINPKEAELVRLIFHKYALEQMGVREIARYLQEMGYKTPRGNPLWNSATIVKILKNEKYAGDLVQKKSYTPDYLTHEKRRNTGQVPMIVIEGHHEPIIGRELWEMTCLRMRQRNKQDSQGCKSSRYVLSGKMKCGVCGASYVGRIKYAKDGTKTRRWSCGTVVRNGAQACGIGRLIRDDDGMQMLKTALRSLKIQRESITVQITELALAAMQSHMQTTERTIQRLSSEIKRVETKMEAVMDSYFSGDITKEEMKTMRKRYHQKMEELRSHLYLEKDTAEKRRTLCLERERVAEFIRGLISGEGESYVFYKTILREITVFTDKNTELRFHELPMIFRFETP